MILHSHPTAQILTFVISHFQYINMCANVLSIYSLASRTFHDTVFWLPCVFLQVAGCSVALVRIGTGSGPDQTNKLTKPDQPILVGLEDPGWFNDWLLMDQNCLNSL